MGNNYPTSRKTRQEKSVVKLDFTLETPVEPNMYEFLTQNTN